MNIVYISKYVVFPENGSPSRQYFLSKYLSKLNGNNILLVGSRSNLANVPSITGLYTSKKNGNFEKVTLNGPKIDPGFNLKRIWSWMVFEINLFRIRKKIKKFKPDVIIVSSLSILTFLSGVFFKKWLKIPLIIEVRDIYPLTLLEIGKFSSKHPVVLFLKWVEKTGYKNADLIVSTLPNAKEHILKVLQKPFKFYWLPMGIDIDFYQTKVNTESKLKLNKKKGDFIVAYAGTIGRSNALDTIFEAAQILQKTNPEIRFVFIGNGPLKSFYQEKYKGLNCVDFMPAVSKESLPMLLAQSDLLINTWLNRPIYKFGISPNKWIDYMYAARPILVAFNGYQCIINEAKCGKFVSAENKDALIYAIIQFSQSDPAYLREIGNNGKKYLIENLTYEALAADFYKKLLSVKKDQN